MRRSVLALEDSIAAPSRLRGALLRDPAVACVSVFAGVSAILLGCILHRNQGNFSYTLDDPYIHLALAERLTRGFYGLNAGETVTPSSSILWPFLLMPGAGSAWHSWLPLLYNMVFGAIAAWLIGVQAREWAWLRTGSYEPAKVWLLSLLLVLGANLPGLAFTGMEHVLQVLTAVVCAIAILRAYKGERIPGWSILIVVLGTAVRYESYVLCIALGSALFAQKRPRMAWATLTFSLAIPAAFALFLFHHGLPPLPNSVLAKGSAFATHGGVGANLLASMRRNAAAYILVWKRWPTTIALPVLGFFAWRERKCALHRNILLGATLAVLLQMMVGSYSWFHRYEVYTKIFALLIIVSVVAARRTRLLFPAAVAFLLFADLPYVSATYNTPLAAENIYQQQFQMHRIVQAYSANFAANDIGWVSYQLPPSVYMLDLYGLASNEALHQVKKDAAWMSDEVRRHKIGLVMIYPDWYASVPCEWRPIGRLSLGVPALTANERDVYFYVTPNATGKEEEDARRILRSLSTELPPGARLALDPPRPVAGSSSPGRPASSE